MPKTPNSTGRGGKSPATTGSSKKTSTANRVRFASEPSPYQGARSTALTRYLQEKNRSRSPSPAPSSTSGIVRKQKPINYSDMVKAMAECQEISSTEKFSKNLAFASLTDPTSLSTYNDSRSNYSGSLITQLNKVCKDNEELMSVENLRKTFKTMRSDQSSICFEKIVLGLMASNLGEKEWDTTKQCISSIIAIRDEPHTPPKESVQDAPAADEEAPAAATTPSPTAPPAALMPTPPASSSSKMNLRARKPVREMTQEIEKIINSPKRKY